MTEEDIVKIKKFIDIRNKGYYCSGAEVTTVYNRVFGKNVSSTNCASCIRQRINELEVVLRTYEKVNNEMENKAISSPSETKTKDEMMKERMKAVRAARKPKKDASEVTQQQE